MTADFKIAVLISGRGSNLKAILKNQGAYTVQAVIADKANCPGLEIAKEFNVPLIFSFDRGSYPKLKLQKEAIYNCLNEINPDLICLAGFMQIIEPALINNFKNRIINIHPSLLPLLPGLETHKRAIEQKLSEHGCSVHLVDSGLDTGQVIAQAKLAINPSWDEQTLEQKVLELEHRLYPWVLEKIALKEMNLSCENQINGINYSQAVRNEAKAKEICLTIAS